MQDEFSLNEDKSNDARLSGQKNIMNDSDLFSQSVGKEKNMPGEIFDNSHNGIAEENKQQY